MNERWPRVSLGEVLESVQRPEAPIAGVSYRQLGVRLWGAGAYEREALDGGATRYSKLFRVRADDIVVNKIWARNGSVAIVQRELDGCFVSSEFPLFRARSHLLRPCWMHWLTKTRGFWMQCAEKSRGTSGKNRIKPDEFLRVEIPLPPVDEQDQVAARIAERVATVEEATRLRNQADQQTSELLASRSSEIFSALDGTHPAREFDSFSVHVTSGPRNWAKHYTDGGSRFYRAQDIGPAGRVLHDNAVFVEAPPSKQGRSASLCAGDLMLVITGATVGRVALFREEHEPGFVSQHVAICRFPPEQVDPEYVLWGLRSPIGQEQLLGQRYGQGKPGLNLGNIRDLTLPFPPLPIQRRIGAQLNQFEAQIARLRKSQSQAAAELDALVPSILDRAFNGEI